MTCPICNKKVSDKMAYKAHYKFKHGVELVVPRPTRPKAETVRLVEQSMQQFIQVPTIVNDEGVSGFIKTIDFIIGELEMIENELRTSL